ncbi:efflux RND transporter periplasmic adaptor subunit [Martelella mediterranea]|uniref:HlyD family secretion protein n=1 Tax=Martelella mediterranea TaxID=293089 RepID=A0A4V2V4V0_9HYPH|nr:efflux RND transporter periplasmic adaptor subunit [Martelella mediterranea]TCT42120.1 HlyD family secretion protein [Martelella mediterranea]
MNTRRFPAASFLMLVLLASPALAAETGTPGENNLPAIVVTSATPQQLTERVLGTGIVEPVDEVFVQPLVEGLSIETIEAEIGDRVEKGTVLATLRTDKLLLERSSQMASKARAKANLSQLEAQLKSSEAVLTDARRQYDRAKRLVENGTSTRAALEQAETSALKAQASANAAREAISVAEADLRVTEAQIEDIDLRLARTKIKTPVSGIISDRNARIGAIASGSANPMFTIIEDGAIELVAEVPEDSVMKVRQGQAAHIMLVGAREPINGKVRLVSPVVDEATRLADVFITIEEPESARVGMYASAEIIIEQTSALSLPMTAVNIDGSGATVRRIVDGTVEIVPVSTGIQDGSRVEITGGLESGDQVVAKAGAYVRTGDRVRPVSSENAISD